MEPSLTASSPSSSPPELRPLSVTGLDHPSEDSVMEVQPRLSEDSSAVWDLGFLLDFNLDDQLDISLDYDQNSELLEPLELPPQDAPSTAKVRKRDPRMTCSNYLAGRVPCACPEIDAKLDEEGLPGKKRARTLRSSAGMARCQVPGCEADISELKGYHRRHRVCLRCAHASTVTLDGEAKRYCQQCGKFHILSDFDEGKRSCRRKLEHHNNRRRRKPTDSKAAAAAKPHSVTQTEDSKYDGEGGKDSDLSGDINEKGASQGGEDGQITTLCSVPDTQNVNNDGVVSFVSSGDTQVNGRKDYFNCSSSPSYCGNRSAYSSMCPTARISFKLYDWNPAEFPRRLRLQIFQWLANMPLELEGYIRPGCTILTTFVTMPKFMWKNLFGDPLYYVRDLVAPGKMLSGRGTILVHLNDMIFHVLKGEASVMKVKLQAPRLHYVHPTCFEAGKPMEFVACGSNLLQPKFRLLVSFSGKYLKYDYWVSSPHNWNGDNSSCAFDNQLYKIYVPHTELNLFGPAFIEVENESGLSNFIPVLIGDKDICSEMRTLQQKLDMSLQPNKFQSAAGSICSTCEAFSLRHTASSDLLLDVAWLLKDPNSENFHRVITPSQIQRIGYLLDFLISNDSSIILEKILQNLMILTEKMKSNNVTDRMNDVDMMLLWKRMYHARDILCQKQQKGRGLILRSVNSEMEGYRAAQSCSQDDMPSVVAINCQGVESIVDCKLGVLKILSCDQNAKSERNPLLKRETIMNVEELPTKSGHGYLARGFLRSRPAILVIASVAVCIGVCAALLHPGRVGEFAVSIRRCLLNNS